MTRKPTEHIWMLFPRSQGACLFGLLVLTVLAVRLPFMPGRLFSFDSVNFALALEEFDPLHHQPQPPGYPLFVGMARLLYWGVGTPEVTFSVLKIFISCLAVAFLYLLGKRMFSPGVGISAAALLLTNPVFWYSGLTSPIRPHAALISILVAYLCWRAYCGEHRYFYAASFLLGLSGGVRPALWILLLPLLVWTARQSRRESSVLLGFLLFWGGVLVWLPFLVSAYGGVGRMGSVLLEYLRGHSESAAVLMGGSSVAWRRSLGRALLWNGLGILPWAWTIPLLWLQRRRFAEWKRHFHFLGFWFIPPFLFTALVHLGAPGHTLRMMPVVCLIGGLSVVLAAEFLFRQSVLRLKPLLLALVPCLLISTMIFFGPYPIPQRKVVTRFRGWESVQDAVLVGTFETSYSRIRYITQMTDHALEKIAELKSATHRPMLLLWSNDAVPIWRKVCFYYPMDRLYELNEGGDSGSTSARLWRGKTALATFSGAPPLRLAIPKNARLIWLLHPDTLGELPQRVPLRESFPVYYSDLDAESQSFRWGSFEFVPE